MIVVVLLLLSLITLVMYSCLVVASRSYSRVDEEVALRVAAEKDFENKIKAFLREQGCWYIKYWAGGGFTTAGVPDLLICCNGLFIGAEIKAKNGTPSALQIRALLKIRKAGGIGVLVYPEDELTFRSLIVALKRRDGRSAKTLQDKLEDKVEVWRKKYQII